MKKVLVVIAIVMMFMQPVMGQPQPVPLFAAPIDTAVTPTTDTLPTGEGEGEGEGEARHPDGPRYYYLGPWLFDETQGAWTAPEHTVGLVDFSPSLPKEDIGGGLGFFSTDTPLTDPDYTYFGDSLYERMTAAQKLAWRDITGLDGENGDYMLIDLFWNSLTIWADPDGATFCPPLTPTHLGELELHLGGHSLIRHRRWQGVDDPGWPKVKTMLRNGYRRLREKIAADIAKINSITLDDLRAGGSEDPDIDRVIKAARKLVQGGMTPAQARTKIIQVVTDREVIHAKKVLGARMADFRIKDWRELVPDDLQDWEPLPPSTIMGDTFVDTNGTALASHTATGTGGGFSWTETNGAWSISSNAVDLDSTIFLGSARAESDLSSANHYAEVAAYKSWATTIGAMIRFDPSAINGYSVQQINATSQRIWRADAGSWTTLSTNTTASLAEADVIKIEGTGSTINSYLNSTLVNTVTDSNHSFTRTGIVAQVANRPILYFVAGDLAAAGPPWAESFDTTSGDTLGPDLTWTEVSGDTDIVSNSARPGSTTFGSSRAEAEMSGPDMYAEIVISLLSSSSGRTCSASACARFDASAETYYELRVTNAEGSSAYTWELYKVSTGTATSLGVSGTFTDQSWPETWRISVEGTDIGAWRDGIKVGAVVDGTITTGDYAGIALHDSTLALSTAVVAIDSFAADDYAATGIAHLVDGPIVQSLVNGGLVR